MIGTAFALYGLAKGADMFSQQSNSAIANYVGGLTSHLFGKKSSKYSAAMQAAIQYDYARKYALNSPSWTVEGLRKANLNPILAATDGAFASPTVPSVSGGSFYQHNHSGDYGKGSGISMADALAFAMAEENKKKLSAETDLLRSQKQLTDAKSENEVKNRGLTGEGAIVSRVISELQSKGVLPNNIDTRSHPKSDDSVPSSSIKSTSHPADSSFKPHWSDKSAFGRFFNELDRNVHRERYDRSHKSSGKSSSNSGLHKTPSFWYN